MSDFGSRQERLARLLHEARMTECYGNWTIPSRFRWPETREDWERYQHHPHPAILQAMAQAKAVLAMPDDRETWEQAPAVGREEW